MDFCGQNVGRMWFDRVHVVRIVAEIGDPERGWDFALFSDTPFYSLFKAVSR